MLDDLKKTLRHSLVYSFGNLGGKLAGLILLPLYTSRLSLEDFGVLSIFEITVAIAVQVLVIGFPQAYLRYAPSGERQREGDPLMFTYLSVMAVIAVGAGLFFQVSAPVLAMFFHDKLQFTRYFRLSGWIMGVSVLNTFFLGTVRAREKSFLYITATLSKLMVTLGLTILLILQWNMGVAGVLMASLAGNLLLAAVLIPLQLRKIDLRFDPVIFRQALRFGLPLIVSSLAAMLLNNGGNYFLKAMDNYEQVGLYNLAGRIAGVLNMVFIQSFTLGFLPIAFKKNGQPGALRYYSKMMTYFTLLLVWAGLILSLFSHELLWFFGRNQDFWPAATLIPVMIIAYIPAGMRAVASLGLYVSGETSSLARETLITLAVSIILNVIFIRTWSSTGAVWAGVLSSVLLLFLTLRDSTAKYPIPYEYSKLLKLILTGGGLYAAFYFLGLKEEPGIALKILIAALFPAFLFFLRFYEDIELLRMRQSLLKWSRPSTWKKLLLRR